MLINISKSSNITNLQEFLKTFNSIDNIDVEKGTLLDFDLSITKQLKKIAPILRLAKPRDASKIKFLFMEAYKGTYPFKIMEDIKEIKRMINSSDYDWFIFETKEGETSGCFGAKYYYDDKKAYLYGYVISKKYQKVFDTFKAFIGALIYIWRKFKDEILIWFGEMRTNNNTSQWCTNYCGMQPVAFFPNKDLFFNKPESEFLHVGYNIKALEEYRVKKSPKIIRCVLDCYQYSNQRYHLGLPIIENPRINTDQEKIKSLKENLVIRTDKDKFENKMIKYYFKNTNSYFSFLYNKNNNEIEKCEYNVLNLDELCIYVEFFKKFIKKNRARYSEIYISAYKPSHQKIFVNAGFKPCGYIPSWKYKKNDNCFYDNIVFVLSKGEINNVSTIYESKKLIKTLKILEDPFDFEIINN